ncbi:MAG: single-stranded-DNA-specific exonuclease RecJ [Treponema sp.]|nr:single-stranded-DNA-specific exonuclease RecJ [Treponema sp.]
MKFNKKAVTKSQIDPICEKYKIDPILASIFVRRGITEGPDLFYFLDSDIHFEHNPFLFSQMEDAVERILAAKEEGEKVLIFGDRDVDGITSTAILYNYMKKAGFDVSYRVPKGDEPYGLSVQAVEEFAAQNGTLIITVDCGISCYDEIEKANELGVDVIVTDHHNPPDRIPNAVAILDAKVEGEEYPFKDISGAAVSYKLVSALRFAQSSLFKADICLLNIEEIEEKFEITVLKVRNHTKYKIIKEIIVPGQTYFTDTRLPLFLGSNYIYVWDSRDTIGKMKALFGNGIDFSFMDLKSESSRIWPAFASKNLSQLKDLSKTSRFGMCQNTEIEALFNIYITYANYMLSVNDKNLEASKTDELQLVGIAAMADIMPMRNENRLFVKNCVKSIKEGKAVPGLQVLLAKLKLMFQNITAQDLAWVLNPCLNAAGRLGKPDIALELLVTEDPKRRETLAEELLQLNEDRKKLVNDALYVTKTKAEDSISKNDGKIIIVADESIHKGITGLLAGKLLSEYNVPSIALTKTDGVWAGSMRSTDNVIATDFLKSFGDDFFIAYGGHNAAAGFSFDEEKFDSFLTTAKSLCKNFTAGESETPLDIDAEIPRDYLTPGILDTVKLFEPFGNDNEELVFYSPNLKIIDSRVMGAQSQHLKVTLDCGKHKFPALFWNAADKLNRDFSLGDEVSVLYNMNENFFNGTVTPQMIVKDLWRNQ